MMGITGKNIFNTILLAAVVVASSAFPGDDGSPGVEPPEDMVLIPGDTYQMGIDESDLDELEKMGKKVPHMSSTHSRWWFGDEIPKHSVVIPPFYMDRCEVTNRQFMRFVSETGYRAQGEWKKYASPERQDHPVVLVTWYDAGAYASWAGKRLPTEEEWEYAAGGGGKRTWFPWGNEPDSSKANYRHRGESFFAGLIKIMGLRKIKTTPGGTYPPNGFNLFDMIGNVSEWCQDERKPFPNCIKEDWPYRRFGPWGEDDLLIYGKAVRGGSWESPNPVFIRTTFRSGFPPETSSRSIGFRCVKSP